MDTDTKRRSVCCELVSDVARASGEVRLKVTGSSMLPAIWPGDVVTVRRCDLSELQPGQIALYSQEGKLTVHRVKRVLADHLIARGDSVPRCDPPVNSIGVVGQVVTILRSGRTLRPEQSFRHRMASSVLRRSDFCTRITLRLGSRMRRLGDMPVS
jgi:signal peptidase